MLHIKGACGEGCDSNYSGRSHAIHDAFDVGRNAMRGELCANHSNHASNGNGPFRGIHAQDDDDVEAC